MTKKAYVWTVGTTLDVLIQIGQTRFEPASGKSWKVRTRPPLDRSCVVEVPSQDMGSAKSAVKKAIKKCGSVPWGSPPPAYKKRGQR